LDTISIKGAEASLLITAPEADMYHKLTVLLGRQPVLVNSSPKMQGAKIRLKEMNEGDIELLFLCNHFLVDVGFDIQVLVEWEGGKKLMVIPVSTFENQGLVIRFDKGG
jgi:hypothetical protein